MKKLFLLVSVAFFAIAASAQGTLEFNQVLLLSNSNNYTVPANTVWKMTGMTSTTGGSTGTALLTATINGVTNYFFTVATSYNTPALQAGQPLWLPAGTTITPTNRTQNISVIEFNIVP